MALPKVLISLYIFIVYKNDWRWWYSASFWTTIDIACFTDLLKNLFHPVPIKNFIISNFILNAYWVYSALCETPQCIKWLKFVYIFQCLNVRKLAVGESRIEEIYFLYLINLLWNSWYYLYTSDITATGIHRDIKIERKYNRVNKITIFALENHVIHIILELNIKFVWEWK